MVIAKYFAINRKKKVFKRKVMIIVRKRKHSFYDSLKTHWFAIKPFSIIYIFLTYCPQQASVNIYFSNCFSFQMFPTAFLKIFTEEILRVIIDYIVIINPFSLSDWQEGVKVIESTCNSAVGRRFG